MIENQPIVVGILNSPEGIQYLDESAIRQELPPLTQEEIVQQQAEVEHTQAEAMWAWQELYVHLLQE